MPSGAGFGVSGLLQDLDLLLIMTVNPGYGGQSFIPSMLSKIEKAARLLEKKNPDAILEVDGGVKQDNIRLIVEAGAELLVAGSAVFGEDPAGNLRKLRKVAAGEHGK